LSCPSGAENSTDLDAGANACTRRPRIVRHRSGNIAEVDDRRRRGMKRSDPSRARLDRANLRASKPPQARHAIRPCPLLKRVKPRQLALVGSDHELSALVVPDGV